jgi:hypothetical protein
VNASTEPSISAATESPHAGTSAIPGPRRSTHRKSAPKKTAEELRAEFQSLPEDPRLAGLFSTLHSKHP